MALPFDCENINVMIKLPGNCHYFSRNHHVVHCSGPMTDRTCRCKDFSSSVADEIRETHKEEISKKKVEIRNLYSTSDYSAWLADINSAISRGDSVYKVENPLRYELPRLDKDAINIYNFYSKDGISWIMSKRSNKYYNEGRAYPYSKYA